MFIDLTNYQTTNFRLIQTEEFADNNFKFHENERKLSNNNFKFHENERKLSKQEENTVGKGEIACYEQFLLFPQCFQKARFPRVSKGVTVGEWVKGFSGGGATIREGALTRRNTVLQNGWCVRTPITLLTLSQ